MIEHGFLSPASLEELHEFRQRFPDASLIAGATDLGLDFTQSLQSPETLIYTGKVLELKQIEQTGDSLLIGAAVTYSEMLPKLNELYPAFAAMVYRLGSLQIRNQGTLGGNIANASPIGDTPPVVLVLDGLIHLQSNETKRIVEVDKFFSGYRQTQIQKNECIVAIELPLLQEDEVLKVYKVSKRFDDDISAICMAVWIKFDIPGENSERQEIKGIRLAYGGMAATPKRAKHTEQLLTGKCFSDETINLAKQSLKEDFQPIDDVRASAAYRIEVAGQLLLRTKLELEGQHAVNLFDHRLHEAENA